MTHHLSHLPTLALVSRYLNHWHCIGDIPCCVAVELLVCTLTDPDGSLSSSINRKWRHQQIIMSPNSIQRTRPLLIKPNPRLSFPAPMQQAHRTRMQIPADSHIIIPSETVLVPAVIHLSHIPGEHQQKRRQRSELIDPDPLL